MPIIYFATSNKGKFETVKGMLSKYGLNVIQAPIELPEPRSDDLKVIAKVKAEFAWQQIKKPVIVMDSGFYIYALNGFPKAFVHLALDTIGIKGILKLVKGQSRQCEFRNCLAYYDKKLKQPVYFESPTKGKLLEQARKPKHLFWGELHTIFLPQGAKKTFSQMSAPEIQDWQAKYKEKHYAAKFGRWFLKNR